MTSQHEKSRLRRKPSVARSRRRSRKRKPSAKSKRKYSRKSRRSSTRRHHKSRSKARDTRRQEQHLDYSLTVDVFLSLGFEIVSQDLEWMCPVSSTTCKDKPVRPRRMGYSLWFSELMKSKDTESMVLQPTMFGKQGDEPIAFQAVWMRNLRTRKIRCYGLHFVGRFDATETPPSADPTTRIGQMTRPPLYPVRDDRKCIMPPMMQQDAVEVLMSDLLRSRANGGEFKFFAGTKYEFWSFGRLVAFSRSDRSQTFYAVIAHSPDLC